MKGNNIDELNYIIYNNRSTDLVLRFIDTYDMYMVNEVEKRISFIKNQYNTPYGVDIDVSWCDLNVSDILFEKKDLIAIKPLNVVNNYDYLINRGFTLDIIKKYGIKPIELYSENDYDILGVTLHPSIDKVLDNQISGSFVIPFYGDDGNIINYCIRRTIACPLKYSMSIPDVGIFGLNDINEGDELWITEGVFDSIALKESGVKSVSVSSALS